MTPTEEKKIIFTKAAKMLDEIYWGGEVSTDNLTVLPELRKTLTPLQAEAAEAIRTAREKTMNALIELNSGRER